MSSQERDAGMASEYYALAPRETGVNGSPTWPSADVVVDSGTAYPNTGGNGTTVQKRTSRPPLSSRYLAELGVALHIAVLLLHGVLFIIWYIGLLEEKLRVPLSLAARVQTLINLISHAAMLAFSVAIVALMQVVASRAPFGNLPQPLTALSDNISSWRGLGSSLLNLCHNLRFQATLGSTLLTTLYFMVLSGLGVSSSFLFNVPAVNETTHSDRFTRIGSPSIRGLIPPESGISDVPSDFTNLTFSWYRSGMGVGMLNSDNTSVYPGLTANRIYDTLLLPMSASSNASAVVGYTDFNVKCGSVPQAHISVTGPDTNANTIAPNESMKRTANDSHYFVHLSIDYMLGSSQLTLNDGLSISGSDPSHAVNRLWQPADILLRVPDSDVVPGFGRNLVLYNIYDDSDAVASSGSQPILDYDGSPGSPWPLNIPDLELNTSLMIQVIGCSLSTSGGLAIIDATTNQMLSPPSSLLGANAHSTWADWKPDLEKSATLEDTWASMFLPNVGSVGLWDSTPVRQGTTLWSCFAYQVNAVLASDAMHPPASNAAPQGWGADQLKSMYGGCHVPTVIEDYLTTRIFGPVRGHNGSGDATRDPSSANATLAALESALAHATAMAMWSAARANTLTVTSLQVIDEDTTNAAPFPAPSTILAPVDGSAYVVEQILVGSITVNNLSLLAGIGLTLLLTMLGMWTLIRDARAIRHAPINDAGLLYLMSLDNSAIAARLSASKMSSVKRRRRAGAFLVEIVDGRLVPVEEKDQEDSTVLSLLGGI